MAKIMRIRALPWLLLFEAARAVHSHVMDDLSPRDRRRVGEILRASHGNPLSVTSAQRDELRSIAAKFDVKGLGRDMVPHAVSHARRRGRK